MTMNPVDDDRFQSGSDGHPDLPERTPVPPSVPPPSPSPPATLPTGSGSVAAGSPNNTSGGSQGIQPVHAQFSPSQPTGDFGQSHPSVFEKADGVVSAIGNAANSTGRFLSKIYGVIAVILGLAILFVTLSSWWAGLIIGGYGVYLLWPGGDKWVMW